MSNDTRALEPDALFAALKTERRDGHDFLDAAAERGAAAAVVQDFRPESRLPQLVVSNVGEALLQMAAAYRQTWQAPVIGITGSCGKTTCKELLSLLLGPDRTLSTPGNLNNLIGAPISMLRPSASAARFVALEAGISEPGEMEQLALAIDPDWVVVTAIGPSHLQDLGTESNVAIEKGKLAQGGRVKTVFAGESCEQYAGYLGGMKVKIVRLDDQLTEEWSYRFTSSWGGSRLQQKIFGETVDFEYRGLGKAMASNVALAVAVASRLGVSTKAIQEGLSRWENRNLRGEWLESEGRLIFADCYNANPISMRDALETFTQNTPDSEPRLFVIGCMEELGKASSFHHEELGIDFPFRKEDFLLVLGGEASSVLRGMKNMGHDMSRCEAVDSLETVKLRLKKFEGNVFLKGSRRYRLEDALQGISYGRASMEGGAAC